MSGAIIIAYASVQSDQGLRYAFMPFHDFLKQQSKHEVE